WKHFDSRLALVTPRRVLLLYDCDTGKTNGDRGNVAKRIIPSIEANPIAKGIENLFSPKTIGRIRAANPNFIDVTPALRKVVRGEEVDVAEVLEVNKDEKRNLCNWLMQHGTVEDFENFESIFDLIEQELP